MIVNQHDNSWLVLLTKNKQVFVEIFYYYLILILLHLKRVWHNVIRRLFKQLNNNFSGSKSCKFGIDYQRKVFAVEKNWDYGVCS